MLPFSTFPSTCFNVSAVPINPNIISMKQNIDMPKYFIIQNHASILKPPQFKYSWFDRHCLTRIIANRGTYDDKNNTRGAIPIIEFTFVCAPFRLFILDLNFICHHTIL